MATQKYRGAHSPEAKDGEAVVDAAAAPKFRAPVKRGFMGANFLFFVPLPLLFDGFSKMKDAAPFSMLVSFGCFALLVLSAWVLREGLKAEIAFNARKIARPPAVPRKMLAAALTGTGVAIATMFGWDKGLIAAIIFGGFAAGAHIAAFGIDPLRKKGLEGQSDFDVDRVARAVEKSEALIAQITAAAGRIGERDIETKVGHLTTSVQEMLRTVENDPRDLNRARKYMTVYLTGARDATVKFADLYARSKDAEKRTEYLSLISDLETSFDGQREALLRDNASDLDIEIEVLQERLQREGHLAENNSKEN